MSGMSKFPVMQDRKTAEAGKNPLGPIGGEKKKKKVCHFEKKSFSSFGKKHCWLKKKNVGWKKNSVGEFPLPKTEMSGMSKFPVMQDQKTAEAGKKPPRA